MSRQLGICDKCGKPVMSDDLRYTLLELDDIFRHASCQGTSADLIKGMNESISKMKNAITRLKTRIKRFDQ